LQLVETMFLLGQTEDATDYCRKALDLNATSADALNSLAWKFATSADHTHRDPALAVMLAERAVQLSPENGTILNTLGVAHYRAGDFQQAVADLEKSVQLRHGGDPLDFFFLAMTHWQLGDHIQARQWYDEGVAWMSEHNSKDEQQGSFRTEAAQLLGISQPKSSTAPSTRP
jgi:tetratricopeptide (TPR) repeat protein